MKSVLTIILLSLLVGCGQVSGENLSERNQDQFSLPVMSNNDSFLSFKWIEEGYNGMFSPIQANIDHSMDKVMEQLGEPRTQGHHEGGVYWEYEQATYFFDPITNKGVAIAIDVEEHQLTSEEMRKQLGTPDQSEMNEMNGYWMFVYKLEDYELLFEAKSEKDIISYAWLRKANKH
ncbi:DUF4309 domain-containing protein [Halalkalibacter alkaliphilus]|uniref:YjgB family protein n=1 Tax=Halalkalibacter alkaliphilus TaxID=2917993 RepID=A0A9X2A3Q0_9BACI|nr:DUF4309 domain-containing protein [Halalkalibacter alkaliphilus]MCL7746282.1 YjgB family protein [Halalkalibacter alkaliphilus]